MGRSQEKRKKDEVIWDAEEFSVVGKFTGRSVEV